MSVLANKLRAARRFEVVASGFTFVLLRPTDIEFIALRGTATGDRLLNFLVDWRGVKESDVLAGGDPFDVKFDLDDAREWLSDRPDLFNAITSGIIDAYNAHAARLEATPAADAAAVAA